MKLNRASGGPGTEKMSREDRENVLTVESSDIGAGNAKHRLDNGVGARGRHNSRRDQRRPLENMRGKGKQWKEIIDMRTPWWLRKEKRGT